MDEILLGTKEWVAIFVTVLGAFGLFIANLAQIIKTKAEAKKTRAETEEIKKRQQSVLDQFQNNGGSTLKDATDRIEDHLKETAASLNGQLEIIRGELGFQRREILRLAEVDDKDRELASEVHREIRNGIGEIKNTLTDHINDTPNIIAIAQKEVFDTLEKRERDAIKQQDL